MKVLLGGMRAGIVALSICLLFCSFRGNDVEAEKWRAAMVSCGVLYLVVKPKDQQR